MFRSTYIAQYSSKFKSKHIRILSMKSSTQLWQWIKEPWDSKFNQPKLAVTKILWLSLQNFQISFSTLDMKLWIWIDARKGLDLAQLVTSIFMFMYGVCTILYQFLQSTAWSLPNDDQGTRICNEIQVLCEEFSNLEWEKFWREFESRSRMRKNSRILLWFGIYTLS